MFGVDLSPTTNCVIGVTFSLLLYWFSTRKHNYWKKRGVPFVKPVPFLGCLLPYMRKPAHEVERDHYNKYGLIYGYYIGNMPGMSVGDPEVIREILVKDFLTFNSRQMFLAGYDDVLDNMLSCMKGDENWKRIRTIISPTFTTGKIKKMLDIFKDCSKTAVENFRKASTKGESIDAKKLYGAFTMDVIARSAFSTKIDSHNDPENKFVKLAGGVLNESMSWKHVLILVFPPLLKVFNIDFFPKETKNFFKQTTLEIIEERKRTGETRNDFLQLMMDTAKEVEDNEVLDLPEKNDIASNYGMHEDIHPQILKSVVTKSLSMDELVSQSINFFISGYDSTASTLSFASYLLALNPDKQDRLRQEVDDVLKEFSGELTYEATQNMKYLDNVISETLRMYPPVMRLERTADADHKLGDTDITVPKGMVISIPIYAMHKDPKIFPNPDSFDPDRFTPEERANRNPYTYLPFGAGPRNCIAMRFALMEVKVCLAYVIANFYIKRCPETKVPLEFGKGQVILRPNGIILELETRKDALLLV